MIEVSNGLGYRRAVATRKGSQGWGGFRPGSGRKRIVQHPSKLAVDFERGQMNQLKGLADRRGESMASLVRTAVSQYLRRVGRK